MAPASLSYEFRTTRGVSGSASSWLTSDVMTHGQCNDCRHAEAVVEGFSRRCCCLCCTVTRRSRSSSVELTAAEICCGNVRLGANRNRTLDLPTIVATWAPLIRARSSLPNSNSRCTQFGKPSSDTIPRIEPGRWAARGASFMADCLSPSPSRS